MLYHGWVDYDFFSHLSNNINNSSTNIQNKPCSVTVGEHAQDCDPESGVGEHNSAITNLIINTFAIPTVMAKNPWLFKAAKTSQKYVHNLLDGCCSTVWTVDNQFLFE